MRAGSHLRGLLVASSLALPCGAWAETPSWRLQMATGAQYSSGEYGEIEQTDALVIPFFARAARGPWSLQVSVPWVSVRGPERLGELLDDNGGLGSNSGSGGSGSGSDDEPDEPDDDDPPPPPDPDDEQDASGLGDTSITAGYSFDTIGGSPVYVDLRARARLATGDRERGLGSGTTDYAVFSELGYAARHGGVFVVGGRRFLGDVPGVARQDGWQASAGAWWNVSPRLVLGMNYDWRDASVRGGEDPRFAEAYVGWYLSDTWKLEINAGTGLSDASADLSAGFTLTWRSTRRAARP